MTESSGARRLERGGLILGAFCNASFEEETVSLEPGDVVVVFSDGITEALSPDVVSLARNACSLRSVPVENYLPHACCRTVLDSVREFIGGGEQSDDLTALVLRYTGS